jgi:hypothetical protein
MTYRILRSTLPGLLALIILSADAQESPLWTGTYDGDCEGYTFHLAGPRDSAPAGELRLPIRWSYLFPRDWASPEWRSSIDAKWCGRDSTKCEDAANARIQFDNSGKRVSGKFTADFGGKTVAGTFKVKFHHHGRKPACL